MVKRKSVTARQNLRAGATQQGGGGGGGGGVAIRYDVIDYHDLNVVKS